jgi:hypothetical protein
MGDSNVSKPIAYLDKMIRGNVLTDSSCKCNLLLEMDQRLAMPWDLEEVMFLHSETLP